MIFRQLNPAQDLLNLNNAAFDTWFHGSKVINPETGDPLIQYHGTCHDKRSFRPFTHFSVDRVANVGVQLSRIKLGMAHFTISSPEEFQQFSQTDWAYLKPGISSGHIYPVYLRIKNPLELPDEDNNHSPIMLANQCRKENILSYWSVRKIKGIYGTNTTDDVEKYKRTTLAYRFLRNALMSKGYDGIRYKLIREHPGNIAWMNFSPAQVRFSIKPNRFYRV